MKRLLLAEWIAPMDGPVVREGGVVFEGGRIVAVGKGRELRREHPDAVVEDVGQAVVLPGLVNAHTHLELSDRERAGAEEGFVGWLKQVILRGGADAGRIEEAVEQAIRVGVGQCLRFGVTSVGDISRQCGLTRRLLRGGRLRVVSYGEVQGMAQRRGMLEERLAAAVDETWAEDRLKIGVSPHAPYSIEESGFRRCLEVARGRGMPLATHLAETAEEGVFLAEHGGELRGLWDFLGWWDERVPRFEGGPIRFAERIGLLDYPTLLAHVNYCDDEEMGILARGRASVVYCPRTHAYFGHPPHRWRQMMGGGINVAVGTDSCASSPDLDLVEELRVVHRIGPEVEVERIWEMGTMRAARAIGMENEVGTIAVGKAADLVVFGANGDDPLWEVLETEGLTPAQVWVGGERQSGEEA